MDLAKNKYKICYKINIGSRVRTATVAVYEVTDRFYN